MLGSIENSSNNEDMNIELWYWARPELVTLVQMIVHESEDKICVFLTTIKIIMTRVSLQGLGSLAINKNKRLSLQGTTPQVHPRLSRTSAMMIMGRMMRMRRVLLWLLLGMITVTHSSHLSQPVVVYFFQA